MEEDLNLTGNRYSIALLIFFIGYLLGEVGLRESLGIELGDDTDALGCSPQVPSNMILSRSRPSLYLPGIMLVWGVVGGLFAVIQSYEGLVVARFFLVRSILNPSIFLLTFSHQGCVESGFFPGVLFFLSSWYRKKELAKRMAWFYSAAIISGAFGGLLAGAITE